jgi:hypothetical protein
MNDIQAKIDDNVSHAKIIASWYGLETTTKGACLFFKRGTCEAEIDIRYDRLIIEYIKVKQADQYHRYGSHILNDILAIADNLGLPIDLIAESESILKPSSTGLPQPQLQAWYRRYGFIDIDDQLMRRQPVDMSYDLPLSA